MNERDTELAVKRTAVYLEQKRLRTEAAKAIDGSLTSPDFEKAYQGVLIKNREVDALTTWLDSRMTAGDAYAPPDECHRLLRWLIRHNEKAFSGYNPYLLKLARETSKAVEETGFRKNLKTITVDMTKAMQEWQQHEQSR